MQTKKSRLVDVARLSGVSIATVSNVVNRRAKVAEHTRIRVETVLKQLDYKPHEHTLAIRRDSLVQQLDPHDSNVVGPLPPADDTEHATQGPDETVTSTGDLKSGDEVSVSVDSRVLRGVIDAQMPDGSGFWVWCVGAGRKFVCTHDDPVVSKYPAGSSTAE